MYTIYKITDPVGKVYVGCTSRSIKQRIQKSSYNPDMCRAIEESGCWEKWKKEVIATAEDKDEAYALEIKYIAEYDSTNPEKGYNKSTGGEKKGQGVVFSEERRRKISEGKKGRKIPDWQRELLLSYAKRPSTPEAIAKRAEANRGKKRSAETKAKISKAHKGWKVSDETRAKMSESHKGKPLPRYCYDAMSEKYKGVPRPPEVGRKISASKMGHPVSEETRRKISEAFRKKREEKNRREA